MRLNDREIARYALINCNENEREPFFVDSESKANAYIKKSFVRVFGCMGAILSGLIPAQIADKVAAKATNLPIDQLQFMDYFSSLDTAVLASASFIPLAFGGYLLSKIVIDGEREISRRERAINTARINRLYCNYGSRVLERSGVRRILDKTDCRLDFGCM